MTGYSIVEEEFIAKINIAFHTSQNQPDTRNCVVSSLAERVTTVMAHSRLRATILELGQSAGDIIIKLAEENRVLRERFITTVCYRRHR
jgi:hypothetical protein